jgi:hypothetical protein
MPEDLTSPKAWEKLDILGAGSYNYAIRSDGGQFVLKIQQFDLKFDEETGLKHKEEKRPKTDTAERSVRLWNEINAGLNPPAFILSLDGLGIVAEIKADGTEVLLEGVGWVCPYIEGVQASDEEIQGKLLEIFNRTGRIITDATAKKNFIRTPNGTVVCIDIGMALEMEKRDEVFLAEEGRARSNSFVSLETWKKYQHTFTTFFSDSEKAGYPHSVNTIKALLFIKEHRPDIYNMDFLKTSHVGLIQSLAKAYDAYDPQKTSDTLEELDWAHEKREKLKEYGLGDLEYEVGDDGLEFDRETRQEEAIQEACHALAEEQSVTFESIKASCVHVLTHYIESQGAVIEKQGTFQPARITQWLRDDLAAARKTDQAKVLIGKLEKAESLDALEACIEKAVTPQKEKPGPFPAFDMCHVITGVARDMPDLELGLGPTITI